MMFPLDFWDISLLQAVIAIILLVSSGMLSAYYGKVDMFIDKKKLKNVAIAISIIFLISLALRIITMLMFP